MFEFRRLQDWQDLHEVGDAELADKIGCSRSTLQRAKRGERPFKTARQIALFELTGIKPAECAEFFAECEMERARAAQKKSARAEAAA